MTFLERVPVTIRRSALVPPGAAAWVPVRRLILVRPSEPLTERLLAHELAHVTQAETFSWPLAYLAQWARTGFSYSRMPFEVAARKAEVDPWYRAWAHDLMRDLWAKGELDA
jgi:hypothetical protein